MLVSAELFRFSSPTPPAAGAHDYARSSLCRAVRLKTPWEVSGKLAADVNKLKAPAPAELHGSELSILARGGLT